MKYNLVCPPFSSARAAFTNPSGEAQCGTTRPMLKKSYIQTKQAGHGSTRLQSQSCTVRDRQIPGVCQQSGISEFQAKVARAAETVQ